MKSLFMRCGRLAAVILLSVLCLCLSGCGTADAGRSRNTADTAESASEDATVRAWYAAQKQRIDTDLQTIAEEKEHPCVYVTTQEGRPVNSTEEYVPAMVDVFNCAEEYRLTAPGGIRVRGNSADVSDEKPYRIKFEQKQKMLGLHDGRAYKSWVLLRSYWNLAPDYMALHLAKTVFGGEYYSSDCVFVNLYLNGEPQGIYVLCEQNQAAKDRIDITEPEQGDGRTNVGYLLEMDNHVSEEDVYFTIPEMPEVTDLAGTARVLPARDYTVKSDLWSEEQEEYIRQYTQSVFTVLYEAAVHDKPMMLDAENRAVPADGVYATGFEAVCAVLDPDSLADMIIVEELVQNYDVGSGNCYMAVDFSQDSRYPRLTFLAPWDFNWAYYEDPDAGYYASVFQKVMMEVDRSNIWYILAMKMEDFRQIVKEKWRALSQSGALSGTVDEVLRDCRSLEGDLGEDAGKIKKAENIGDYVRARILWLDRQWK
ncbi:MAG: CotH kinase family protein [Eubacteriales bacterium]|nr:CotH kinase family protein [Eubacteriales bacterium]